MSLRRRPCFPLFKRRRQFDLAVVHRSCRVRINYFNKLNSKEPFCSSAAVLCFYICLLGFSLLALFFTPMQLPAQGLSSSVYKQRVDQTAMTKLGAQRKKSRISISALICSSRSLLCCKHFPALRRNCDFSRVRRRLGFARNQVSKCSNVGLCKQQTR